MKRKPSLSIIQGLLFTYNIENTDDLERETFIASKDVNDDKELAELFDELTKPEFLSYTKPEQDWFIESIEHYLFTKDSFDSVFTSMATYFDDPVADQINFMRVLVNRLKHYKNTQ
ncbi:hypothetical protein [Pseudomonas kitaguniensis]|uniref:hypothetical protein n=1 Tax=Pseudomonas kitaguniensis TaxID=2607908 RepID=UPI003B9F5175